MADYDYLPVSNGSGDAILMHITVDRALHSTTITVDSVVNVPTKFIGTTGTLLASGFIDPATKKDFKGHVDTGSLIIDAFEPGSTDAGNTAGQVVIIKPNTGWANRVASFIKNATNFGTPEPITVSSLTATGAVSGASVQQSGVDVMPVGALLPYAGRAAPGGWLLADGSAVSRTTYAALFSAITPSVGTFSVTIAAPGVFTLNTHGLNTGAQVYLTTTGALPTGLSANTLYYAVKIDANTFNLATTRANAYAGTKITTTGTQSGTHSIFACPFGLGDGSTTFNVPDLRGRVIAGSDAMGGTAASRLTATDTTHGVYGNTGAGGGEQSHTLLTAEMPSHTHGVPGGNNTGSGSQAGLSGGGGAVESTTSTGSDGAHNVVQPTLVANYIVKT